MTTPKQKLIAVILGAITGSILGWSFAEFILIPLFK